MNSTFTATFNDLENFKKWLTIQKYQTNTIRNYIVDVKVFLESSNNEISVDTIAQFMSNFSNQNNYSRHLASISKFCQFAYDQQIISINPYSIAKKQTTITKPTHDLDLLLSQFANSLAREHKSPITIKNYLGDIRQYIRFCES